MINWWEDKLAHDNIQVDDVMFAQPVGFVWFQKPRYRVKAISKKQQTKT